MVRSTKYPKARKKGKKKGLPKLPKRPSLSLLSTIHQESDKGLGKLHILDEAHTTRATKSRAFTVVDHIETLTILTLVTMSCHDQQGMFSQPPPPLNSQFWKMLEVMLSRRERRVFRATGIVASAARPLLRPGLSPEGLDDADEEDDMPDPTAPPSTQGVRELRGEINNKARFVEWVSQTDTLPLYGDLLRAEGRQNVAGRCRHT